jgi:hypothetical protein
VDRRERQCREIGVSTESSQQQIGQRMALFRSDPMKTLQRDIDAAKANRDRLAAKLAESETAITERRARAMQLARDGAEDGALDKAEAAIRSAQDRCTTLAAALGDVEAQLAALEKTFAENADRIEREHTAKEVEQLARRWTDACAALVDAAAKVDDYGERMSMIVPEAGAAWHLSKTIKREIPQNAELIVRLARQHGASVIAGSAPSAMPQPPEPYVEVLPPLREPTAQLFALRSIKWRDDKGQQRFVGQYRDASVPQRLVARALRSGACVVVNDPRRAKLHTQGGTTQHPDGAFDLDEPEPERLAEPIMASTPQFVPFDRGPPKVMQIGTGTRSQLTESR